MWSVNLFQVSTYVIKILLIISLLSFGQLAAAAPKKALLNQWQGSDALSRQRVDHSQWQKILDQYLVTKNRQTYFSYADAKQDIALPLDEYIDSLEAMNPLLLNRKEQLAYWVNLYNAATVQLILQYYPVQSITKLGKGWFSFGPWDDDILFVNDIALSLNDIEHGILRPIYHDPRIHYAVNCASISCPNLLATALTASNTEDVLEKAARDYINHPRGVMLKENQWILSKIYDWYQVDFGDDVEAVFNHLKQYAEPALLKQLTDVDYNNVRYHYDWNLNE